MQADDSVQTHREDMSAGMSSSRASYLKPVNGAAVDKRRVLAQAVPEGIADGAEAQHHMQALLALLHKEAPHFYWALQPQFAGSWPHHLKHLPQHSWVSSCSPTSL